MKMGASDANPLLHDRAKLGAKLDTKLRLAILVVVPLTWTSALAADMPLKYQPPRRRLRLLAGPVFISESMVAMAGVAPARSINSATPCS
jgi:hypothetical protein